MRPPPAPQPTILLVRLGQPDMDWAGVLRVSSPCARPNLGGPGTGWDGGHCGGLTGQQSWEKAKLPALPQAQGTAGCCLSSPCQGPPPSTQRVSGAAYHPTPPAPWQSRGLGTLKPTNVPLVEGKVSRIAGWVWEGPAGLGSRGFCFPARSYSGLLPRPSYVASAVRTGNGIFFFHKILSLAPQMVSTHQGTRQGGAPRPLLLGALFAVTLGSIGDPSCPPGEPACPPCLRTWLSLLFFSSPSSPSSSPLLLPLLLLLLLKRFIYFKE